MGACAVGGQEGGKGRLLLLLELPDLEGTVAAMTVRGERSESTDNGSSSSAREVDGAEEKMMTLRFLSLQQ